MKILVVTLMVVLTGCTYVTPLKLEIAENYCAPYGGWAVIRGGDSVICKNANKISVNGAPYRGYISLDDAQIEMWHKANK